MNQKLLTIAGVAIGTVGLVGGIVLAILGRGEAVVWLACAVVAYVCVSKLREGTR